MQENIGGRGKIYGMESPTNAATKLVLFRLCEEITQNSEYSTVYILVRTHHPKLRWYTVASLDTVTLTEFVLCSDLRSLRSLEERRTLQERQTRGGSVADVRLSHEARRTRNKGYAVSDCHPVIAAIKENRTNAAHPR